MRSLFTTQIVNRSCQTDLSSPVYNQRPKAAYMFRPSPPTSCHWFDVLPSSMSPWIHWHRTLRLLRLHL